MIPRLRTFVAPLVLGLLAVLAWSAPMLPGGAEPADQLRSLAGLTRLRLSVPPMPALLESEGVTAESIRLRWSDRLEESGIEVTADPADPELRLIVSAVTDRLLPDGIAYNPYLTLEQPVEVERVRRRLIVPTYTHVMLGLEARSNVADSVKRTVDAMLVGFIQGCENVESDR